MYNFIYLILTTYTCLFVFILTFAVALLSPYVMVDVMVFFYPPPSSDVPEIPFNPLVTIQPSVDIPTAILESLSSEILP